MSYFENYSKMKSWFEERGGYSVFLFYIIGVFPDAFKFQENLKKLRDMLQEPTLRELLKKSLSPDQGCSAVFKAVVCI